MNINKDILNNSFSEYGISASNIVCLYDFVSGSGSVVFNDYYSEEEHFQDGVLVDTIYPGLSIGATDNPSSNALLGSGYFAGDDLIRVGLNVPHDNWTIFINWRGYED